MKSLREFVMESSDNKTPDSKSFTFNFEGIEGGEDIVKSLSDLGADAVSVDGNKVTINATKNNVDSLDSVIDVLQQITDIRSQQKNSSDETYAQKTKKLADSLNELNDFIDAVENADDNNGDDAKE